MGPREIGGEKLKQLAIKNNQSLKDENLTQMIYEYSNLGIDSTLFSQQFIEPDTESEVVKLYLTNQSIDTNKILEKNSEKPKSLDNKADSNQKSLIQKTEEKQPIKTELQQTATQQQKPKLIRIKITTKKGDIFSGELISENKDFIMLSTMIGTLTINKKDITTRRIIQ